MRLKRFVALLGFGVAAASLPARGASFAMNPVSDAFVTTGPSDNLSGNNYGGAGSVAIAAPGLSKGEFQSVLQFDLAGALASFDSTFGTGPWSIQSITLQLTATGAGNPIFNAPAAGQFDVSWLQNDSWTEGTGTPSSPGATGITFASLQTIYIGAGDEALGTFSFNGASSGTFSYTLGLPPGFTADVLAGGLVGLRMFAADSTMSGIFNSRSFVTTAARPLLTVVAVPEPDSLALCALGLALLAQRRRVISPRAAR